MLSFARVVAFYVASRLAEFRRWADYPLINVGKIMKRLFYISLLIFTSAISAFAQNDWHTYPARPIADIIKAESSEDSEMGAIIISAAPFSSKTKVTYAGKSRSIGKYTKDFIGLWVQTRNVPTENANMLA